MTGMTTDYAIAILRRMQEPEPFEPQINESAFDALEMAIQAIQKYSTWSQTYSNMVEDSISRQAALELVRDVCDAIMSCCESHYDEETGYEVYDDVREISAILKCNKEIKIALKNMPSALPLLNQATISEDRCGECDAWNKYKNYPSAQPEIIHCKDCKHYNAGFECLIEGYGIERDANWFCGDAERRTDETD